jgi:hypothetical protein
MPGSYCLLPSDLSTKILYATLLSSPPYVLHAPPISPKPLSVITSLLLQLHDHRTWPCLAVRRRNNCIQYNLSVHELHRSRFRRFVTGSNESGWRTWLDSRGLPLAPVTAWITLSSVQFCISLKWLHCCRVPYCFVPDWCNNVILCLYYWRALFLGTKLMYYTEGFRCSWPFYRKGGLNREQRNSTVRCRQVSYKIPRTRQPSI